MEDSTVTRADKALNKGDDVVVCVPWLRIDYVRERMQKVLGSDKSILVRVGINNSETEATTAIVMNHRRLVRALKQTRVENTIMARILLVMGGRDQGYRHCVRMAINTLVQQLCGEETVRLLDLWEGSHVYEDGLYLNGMGVALFAEQLPVELQRARCFSAFQISSLCFYLSAPSVSWPS